MNYLRDESGLLRNTFKEWLYNKGNIGESWDSTGSELLKWWNPICHHIEKKSTRDTSKTKPEAVVKMRVVVSLPERNRLNYFLIYDDPPPPPFRTHTHTHTHTHTQGSSGTDSLAQTVSCSQLSNAVCTTDGQTLPRQGLQTARPLQTCRHVMLTWDQLTWEWVQMSSSNLASFT